MILTGQKIIQEVKSGNLCIDPFYASFVNPNSYNYRLGEQLLLIKSSPFDSKLPVEKEVITLEKGGYVLKPNQLYLGATYETIGSDKYVTILSGRSSLGRLGLFLQVSSDLGHAGTSHRWTLELKVVQPLRVYPLMKIGQITFWKVSDLNMLKGKKYREEVDNYSLYSRPKTPIISKFW